MLLACFAGSDRAAEIRRRVDKQIRDDGDAILDEVVVRINAKHKVRVYDPRRTLAGTLTSAVTWGIFGLLAGGLRGLGIWAILGAVCGGLYGYYAEHLLAKDELKRIGGRLPGDTRLGVRFCRAAAVADDAGQARAALDQSPAMAYSFAVRRQLCPMTLHTTT